MKIRCLILSILALCSMTFIAESATTSRVKFAKNSRLRSGNWVKIGVDRTGIYEISYSTLREMGFSNPEKISLFGRGGAQLNTNFISAGGTQLFKDDLEEVPVMHYGDKIYFYGIGPDEFSLTVSTKQYECGGYFSKKSKNIYSDKGFYFLSDDGDGLQMKRISFSNYKNLNQVNQGVGMVSHELDLDHNYTYTGQLFFGEKTTEAQPRFSWEHYLPGALENAKGAMECVYYMDRETIVDLIYGCEGTDDAITTLTRTPSTSNFTPVSPTLGETTVPGPHSTVFVECNPGKASTTSNLDRWTLTYQRLIPDLMGENGERLAQDFIAFPHIERNTSVKVKLPDGASHLVVDVSSPTAPTWMQTDVDGKDAWIKLTNSLSSPQIYVFDPTLPQLQISGYTTAYTKIRNQDLHSRLSEGADMIIICIPSLRESAEKLADLHRRKEGIKVIVATTDECYNEFSSGVPDPMAYRAAVKMAYSSEYSCKNLLLMGPLFADFRGIVTEKEPGEGIIAYQAHPMNQSRGAQNANDFYGMMADYLSNSALENQSVNVGVAILPVRYADEAQTVIDKIEQHLNLTDISYYLNFHTSIGGVGDNHLHDTQALRHSSYISNLDFGSTISNPLIIDAYGYSEAQRKFFNDLNSGRFLVSYFGHGAEYTLNHEGDFFYASDVYRLRNKILPLIFIAGCQLSNCDRGIRGLGESLVTSTPYGSIGTILATRETWSGQNEELVKYFYLNLFRNGNSISSDPHDSTPTIGEVWAKMKNQSPYNNELAYQLICDPALVIPVVNRPIITSREIYESAAGKYIDISGFIPKSSKDNSIDKDFNATVVIRLLEPYLELVSEDICSKDDPDTKHNLTVRYADSQISMTAVEAVDGEFTARLFVPFSASQFEGKTARIHIVAYSNDLKVGAGTLCGLTFIDEEGNDSQVFKDTEAPSILDFSYDPDQRTLLVKVSDNYALSFADSPLNPAFRLAIDDKDFPSASNIQPIIFGGGEGYTKTIPVYDLSIGTHRAKVCVFDASGNKGVAEISFDYNPNASRYAITLNDGVVNGTGSFSITGPVPDSADIVILDSAGMIVRRDKFNGADYEWDGNDNSGLPVAKGLYKAYMLETGNKSGKGHSSTIQVPVI